MTRIPKKLRDSLAEDPFYLRCCVTGEKAKPGDRIEWHHNLIFGGKQVQARFAILPVLHSIHERANDPDVRERLDWVMLNRMSTEDLMLYGKGINWGARLEYLNYRFGVWQLWVDQEIQYV